MILKNIIIISLISFGLSAQDGIILFKNKNKEIKQIDYKIIGICAAITAPNILFYAMDSKSDKFGQFMFGSGSVVSIACLTTYLGFYLKDPYQSKKPLIHYSCMAVAGTLDGFSEELKFHYPKVKSKMPYLNDQFWNPDLSWRNKYKNGDSKQGAAYVGSTGILVSTTDGYHLTRFLNKGFAIGGIITFDYSKSFKKNLKQVLLTALVYTAAKGTTHFLINN